MNKACGCRIVYDDTPSIFPKNDRIEYCPLHEAAPALYQALSDLTLFFDSSNHISVFAAQINAGSEWVKAARRAVEGARGQKPADDSEMPLGPIKAPARGLES